VSPADKLLPRLHGVKRTGPGKWIAFSPARDERTPSLAIREREDGALLLRDFGGASVLEIIEAVGLTLADLFPERQHGPGEGRQPERRPFNATDLIDMAASEAGLAVVVVSDILHGKEDADFDRLLVAAARLADIKEAVHGRR
jgi:hypothetical protein